MLAPNRRIGLRFAQSLLTSCFKNAGSLRGLALFILIGLVATTFYFPSSATSFRKQLESRTPSSRDHSNSWVAPARVAASGSSSLVRNDFDLTSFIAPAFLPEGIATFTYPGCTEAQESFDLGQTVCAKASGVPETVFPWQVAWVTTGGTIVQSEVAVTDEEHQYIFTLPLTPSSAGTWRVNLIRSNGAVRQSAKFTVHNPALNTADVFVQKIVRDGESSVPTGGSLAFQVIVGNAGPDAAQNVQVIDSTPAGATLLSFTQQVGPACLPASTPNCTISSVANGEVAEFTAVYQMGGSAGSATASATVSSTTSDPNSGNNSSTASFEITAGGGSPCTLVCPTGISRESVGNTGQYVMSSAEFNSNFSPVATGTCGAVTKSITPHPTTNDYTFSIGTTVVTFETESGETCTSTITITDDEAPTISCPGDITTFESPSGSGSATVNYTVNTTDDSGSATVNCNYPSGTSFPVGTTAVICSATDGTNTSPDCTFNVTVNSVSGGTCSLTPPAPIVVDSPANACGDNVSYTVDATDCGPVTCDHPSGSFFPVGETLVTCTSSPDGTSASFTVTVNDVTAPVPNLASLPHLTETCSVTAGVPTTIMTPSGPKVVIELPTATDNCGGQISASTEDERTYFDPGDHIVTWTFTDSSGNTTTQTQTVTVTGNDNAAPVPDVATLTATGECEVTVTPPTATDNCSGTVTGTTSDPLTYTGVGTYIVHWTYTDGVGNSSQQNQTVIVTDVNNPTIALVGASSITVECHTSFSDPGVTTTDDCVPKNVTVATTGALDINTPNSYTLTYTATDGGGNQASVQRTVIVEDTTPPTISCPSPITVYLPLNSTATSTAVTYTAPVGSDSCGPATTVQTAGLASGAQFPVGTTTNTFTVTDGANHSVSCSFTVTVLYNFTGFFSPINNLPTLNLANAGKNIPVKFSLSGNKGLNIFAPDNPYSISYNCVSGVQGVDIVETENPGNSTLTYSPDTYHYNWKTEKSWEGTCRTLVVTLNDGSVHTANFKFK